MFTMPTVTITTNEYKDLVRKAVVYDIKKRELESCSYISTDDRSLFDIPVHIEETVKSDDDF